MSTQANALQICDSVRYVIDKNDSLPAAFYPFVSRVNNFVCTVHIIGRASDLQFIGSRVRVLTRHHCVVALSKLREPTCICLCHQAVYFGTGRGR